MCNIRTHKGGVHHIWIRGNEHDRSASGEVGKKGCQLLMLNQHSFKMCLDLSATELELLDDVGDLLKAMHVAVGHAGRMSYHQKSCTLE